MRLKGLTMDALYENLIRQIAGEALAFDHDTEVSDIRDAVSRNERWQKLRREIVVLEGKVHREKQFNRQVELNGELKTLEEKLENI